MDDFGEVSERNAPACFVHLCRKLERERDEARRERNELNNLLRSVGWGQGEIDSAATIAEENDKLQSDLTLTRKVADELASVLGEYAVTFGGVATERRKQALTAYNNLPHRKA